MEKLAILREPFLESIIHAAPIAIIAVDKKLRIKLMNPRGSNYLELDEQERVSVLDKPITDFLTRFGVSAAPVVNQLLTFSFNFDLPEVKIGERFLNVRCRPLMDGALMTFLNLNNLKVKEAVALNAIMEGQEIERRRFAQDMHDGVGPLLSTLKMGLEGLYHTDNTTEILEIRKEAKRLIELVDFISNDVRNISHSLLPPTLLDYGLETALNNLCTLVQKQAKIPITLFISKCKMRLDATTELGLYRIAQELLNNALKYAHPNTIAVQLIRHLNTVVLAIEDDGIGFNSTDTAKLNGIGFKNVMTRVESLNGTFCLESAEGEGVLATVEVPLKLSEKPRLDS